MEELCANEKLNSEVIEGEEGGGLYALRVQGNEGWGKEAGGDGWRMDSGVMCDQSVFPAAMLFV